MTAKELRRQKSADKHRQRRKFAQARAAHTRAGSATSEPEEFESEETSPLLLPNLGAAIMAFLQNRRNNFTR